MRYKTNDIGEHGLAVDVPLSPSWLAENCPDLGAEMGADGLRFIGRLEPTGDDFLLRGKLSGTLGFTCVKCLEPMTMPIEADMAVVFVEGPDESHLPKGKEVVNLDEGDDGDFALFQDGVIDVGPEMREELFLAVPYSPRCEPECLGICLICGENRDKNPCDCEARENLKRSPFADLANLKPIKSS